MSQDEEVRRIEDLIFSACVRLGLDVVPRGREVLLPVSNGYQIELRPSGVASAVVPINATSDDVDRVLAVVAKQWHR